MPRSKKKYLNTENFKSLVSDYSILLYKFEDNGVIYYKTSISLTKHERFLIYYKNHEESKFNQLEIFEHAI